MILNLEINFKIIKIIIKYIINKIKLRINRNYELILRFHLHINYIITKHMIISYYYNKL